MERRAALASVDLNLLVVLHALLVCRSTVEAGRRLGRTQSAVSHALRRLREEIGDPLLVRRGRELVLTPVAEAMIGPLEELMASAATILSSSGGFDPARLDREFVLAVPDFVELAIVPELLARLERDAPNVSLRTVFLGASVDRAVASGEVDLAVAAAFGEAYGLVVKTVLRDRFVGLVRDGHPFARHGCTAQELALADNVLVTPRGGRRGAMDESLRAMGLVRNVSFRTPFFVAGAMLVADTDKVVVVPSILAARLRGRVRVESFELPVAMPELVVQMAYTPARRGDAAHAWFRACVAEVCARASAAGAP